MFHDPGAITPRQSERVIAVCIDDQGLGMLLQQAARAEGMALSKVRPSRAPAWSQQHRAGWLLVDWMTIRVEPLRSFAAADQGTHVAMLHSGPERDGMSAGDVDPRVRRLPVPDTLDRACALLQQLQQHPLLQAAAMPFAGAASAVLDHDDPGYALASAIAPLPVDVLITGETGVGKDCLARYIHAQYSPHGPFVAVNCAAVPETLAEAELFGYEAGAFTGAAKARAGRVEDADGGVLYLDEIDSCPLWLQAKLLRCLQDKAVARVGSSHARRSSFRLIASTKVPLKKLVDEGQFRSDLYYRLQVVDIELQPIRRQAERLMRVFERMSSEAAASFGRPPPVVGLDLYAQLLAHDWPGNLRELRAAATRHALGLPPLSCGNAPTAATGLRAAVDACERGLLQASLRRWNGNVARASDELGVPVNTLHYRLKRLQIHPQGAGPSAEQAATL